MEVKEEGILKRSSSLLNFYAPFPSLGGWSPRRHIKSIVYGGLDGIITIFSMVASTSGANLTASILITIGFANLLADAFSMSISDYLSSKADSEYQTTIDTQRMEQLEKYPEVCIVLFYLDH
jgi:hypothetical protein